MHAAIRVIAAVLLGCAFLGVVKHLRYISSQTQPTSTFLHEELAASEAALHATPLAAIEMSEKGFFLAAKQEVRFISFGVNASHKQELAAIGWRYVRENGVGAVFCKENIVLTVSNRSKNEGFLQVAWGDADAICG